MTGGIETKALTEIAEEFGSGESQLCYSLCVTANLSNKNNGVILDTENHSGPDRPCSDNTYGLIDYCPILEL